MVVLDQVSGLIPHTFEQALGLYPAPGPTRFEHQDVHPRFGEGLGCPAACGARANDDRVVVSAFEHGVCLPLWGSLLPFQRSGVDALRQAVVSKRQKNSMDSDICQLDSRIKGYTFRSDNQAVHGTGSGLAPMR